MIIIHWKRECARFEVNENSEKKLSLLIFATFCRTKIIHVYRRPQVTAIHSETIHFHMSMVCVVQLTRTH